MSRSDPSVDALFRELPDSYRSIAEELRATIRSEAPDLREVVKWNNPFWVGRSNVICLQCYPDHVNLGFLRGAEIVDRFPQLEGTGKGMRHVKIRAAAVARSPAVRAMIRAAARLDQGAGPPR